jgi:hypothetical protein
MRRRDRTVSEDPEYPDLKIEDLPLRWQKLTPRSTRGLITMSKTDPDGDEHLPPWEMALIRDQHKRRLAFFRKHGVWISGEALAEDARPGDGYDPVAEYSRQRARALGWSEEEIEQAYGPSAPNEK